MFSQELSLRFSFTRVICRPLLLRTYLWSHSPHVKCSLRFPEGTVRYLYPKVVLFSYNFEDSPHMLFHKNSLQHSADLMCWVKQL